MHHFPLDSSLSSVLCILMQVICGRRLLNHMHPLFALSLLLGRKSAFICRSARRRQGER